MKNQFPHAFPSLLAHSTSFSPLLCHLRAGGKSHSFTQFELRLARLLYWKRGGGHVGFQRAHTLTG